VAPGAGPRIGERSEVAARVRAFRARGATGTGFCALGSIKSNLGHTGAAAGGAGVIKAGVGVEHGEIPPSLCFESPNPAIPFAGSPFRVAASLAPWPASADGLAPRAGGTLLRPRGADRGGDRGRGAGAGGGVAGPSLAAPVALGAERGGAGGGDRSPGGA